MIDVVDPPLRVDRDHALAHGIERRHRARPRRRTGRCGSRQHLQRREQQRRLAGAVDQGAGQLDAGDLAVLADELDFIALGRGFAGQSPAQIVLHQLDIFRRDELGQRLADHIRRARAQQRQKARVGEQDGLAVNQHRIVHRLDQALKQLLAVVQPRAALLEILEQLIDRGAQLPERLGFAFEPDAPRCTRFAGEPPDLLGEFVDGALLAPLPCEEHTDAHGQNS